MLEEYKLRCQDRSENEALKSEKTSRRRLQIISLLRRAERKDELIESLKGTINQQREIFAQQREEERQQTAAKSRAGGRLQADRGGSCARSSTRCSRAARADRVQGAEDGARGEARAGRVRPRRPRGEQETVRHGAALLREKARPQVPAQFGAIRRDSRNSAQLLDAAPAPQDKQMLAEMKKASQEEAVERLDQSTKKILFENRRMAEELRLQVGETDELQKAKKTLEEDNKKLRREVALNEQSVKEYAKQGFRQSREIKELGGKVKTLERSLGTTTREHEKEKQGLDRRKIAEMELDGQGLRQLVRMKTKELARDASRTWRRTRTHHHLASHLPLLPLQASVKKLAAIVLHKRNEVETFLLESIEQVKAESGGSAPRRAVTPAGPRGQLPPPLTGEPAVEAAVERRRARRHPGSDVRRVLRCSSRGSTTRALPGDAAPPAPVRRLGRRQATGRAGAAAEDDGGQYGGGGFSDATRGSVN